MIKVSAVFLAFPVALAFSTIAGAATEGNPAAAPAVKTVSAGTAREAAPPGTAREAAPPGTAVTIRVRGRADVRSTEVSLGDLADITVAPGFSAPVEKIAAISLGRAPSPSMPRRITAAAIAGAVSAALELPEGAALAMEGAAACHVYGPPAEPLKKAAAELKAGIEKRLAEMFPREYPQPPGGVTPDSISVTLSSMPSAALLKKAALTDEISIRFRSYRAGLATIDIEAAGTRFSMSANILVRGVVMKVRERIPAGSRLTAGSFVTAEVRLAPERLAEALPPPAFDSEGPLANGDGEFARDAMPGETITRRLFRKKALVRAGQKIFLKVSNNNSIITFDAVSEDAGAEGDTIRAVNTRTRKKYRAVVTGPGEAEALK